MIWPLNWVAPMLRVVEEGRFKRPLMIEFSVLTAMTDEVVVMPLAPRVSVPEEPLLLPAVKVLTIGDWVPLLPFPRPPMLLMTNPSKVLLP